MGADDAAGAKQGYQRHGHYRETPFTPADPNHYEYPFPDQISKALYRAYRQRADAIPNLCLCGRLGEYRYYDMDQAIARGMVLAKKRLIHR